MTLNTVYMLANLLAVSAWILLVASVFSSQKVSLFAARTVPVVLASVYTVLMTGLLPFEGGGFDSLTSLAKLFAQPEIALVGWIHYLAFDLFIGAWQVQTARRDNLSKILVFPALLLTMVLGPLGLLFFLVARFIVCGKWRDAQPGSLTSNG